MSLGVGVGLFLNVAARVKTSVLSLGQPARVAIAEPAARTPAEQRRDLDDLVAAYPQALSGHDGAFLHWRDGGRTAVGAPQRSAPAVLAHAQVSDIFAWPYPLGPLSAAPRPLGDPGRARPSAVFLKLYGDCRRGEAQKRLVEVPWPGGHQVRFTEANGAAAALGEVGRELGRLDRSYAKYLWPISGTFNCRVIAGSDDLSMHAYGAAIDLASRHGGYWRWGGANASSTIPYEVVEVFERHGFIWGAKWAHFDSFHFEYRPELIRAARRRAQSR